MRYSIASFSESQGPVSTKIFSLQTTVATNIKVTRMEECVLIYIAAINALSNKATQDHYSLCIAAANRL